MQSCYISERSSFRSQYWDRISSFFKWFSANFALLKYVWNCTCVLYKTATRMYKTTWTEIFNINFGKSSQYMKGSIPDGDKRLFSSLQRPGQLCDPPSFLFTGAPGALSPGVKQPGREADDWPPCSAKFKNEASYTSIALFMACRVEFACTP
jgi:hypothetical protein